MTRHNPAPEPDVEITTFRGEHADQFAALNREWLVRYNLLEPPDEEQLADPQGHFGIDGGLILVALSGDRVVGTCAAAPHGAHDFEIVKLAVASDFRGRGIARDLVRRCIDHAWTRGAHRISLVSNSQLVAAIALYEAFGFKHSEPPPVRPYATADVYMMLERS